MQVDNDKIVTFNYTLTDPQGQVIDTSDGREPLSYLHGAGNIIPGLERQITGMNKGDSATVHIEPAEAYGEKDDRLVQAVPRAAFQAVDKIEPGMRFQASGPEGQQRVVTVTKVDPEQVTVDANHPLAGVPLKFDITIVDVRDATDEEKSHGHAHGPGGHIH